MNANIRIEFSRYNYEFEEVIRNTSTNTFSEKQFRINIPLYASYDFTKLVPELEIAPEFYLGCNFEFVASAKATLIKIDDKDNHITIPEESIKSYRNSFEPSLLVGVNYSYPLIKGAIFFDIHSKIGFAKQNKGSKFNNEVFQWSETNYIENDFKLHNIFLNIGYRYTFYKPTKIR